MGLNNRYEFVFLFDVKDGNPNGDPDAGNLPRIDAETGEGLVTDVCLKRKIRNFVDLTQTDEARNKIFVREKAILNEKIRIATEQEEIANLTGTNKTQAARDWMCNNYYDIRTFGAVMSTGRNAGQIRGPVQITFSRSVDPIVIAEHTLTVVAARTEEKDIESQIGIQGRKFTVPYGLYRCHGFISAHLADQTGFDDTDLELFWQSLMNMFDHDRSAAKGEMSARGLYVFKHDTKLGNAPAHSLLERVVIDKSNDAPARRYNDYVIKIKDQNLPKGVELFRKIG